MTFTLIEPESWLPRLRLGPQCPSYIFFNEFIIAMINDFLIFLSVRKDTFSLVEFYILSLKNFYKLY